MQEAAGPKSISRPHHLVSKMQRRVQMNPQIEKALRIKVWKLSHGD